MDRLPRHLHNDFGLGSPSNLFDNLLWHSVCKLGGDLVVPFSHVTLENLDNFRARGVFDQKLIRSCKGNIAGPLIKTT